MDLTPPVLVGTLSECSRAVRFDFAIPGAKVVVIRQRGFQSDEIGFKETPMPGGVVDFEPGIRLSSDDYVTAYQVTANGQSPQHPDAIKVQRSQAAFNPPRVLSRLYACSPGFTVGGMRSGTRVEVLSAGNPIMFGEAVDGFANLEGSSLPTAGQPVRLRQRVCPSPPPPTGASEWVVESELPPIEPTPFDTSNERVPAPQVDEGNYDCSRSVHLIGIAPGAKVFVESIDQGWQRGLYPSDATAANLDCPQLKEGDQLQVWQEYGCNYDSERRKVEVGSGKEPPQLTLEPIFCNTVSTVLIDRMNSRADLEFEVNYQGTITLSQGIASSKPRDHVPAPKMPDGAMVRVRQGECGRWGAWSEPQTAKRWETPLSQLLQIVGPPLHCQTSVTVTGIHPPAGRVIVEVVSPDTGEIGSKNVSKNLEKIDVNPSLNDGDTIVVKHELCGKIASTKTVVGPPQDLLLGDFELMREGDTQVTLRSATSGADVEIVAETWDPGTNRYKSKTVGRRQVPPNGYSPRVTITLLEELVAEQRVHARAWFCGQYRRNHGARVFYLPPILDAVSPNSVSSPSSDPTAFVLHGRRFRPGAKGAFWTPKGDPANVTSLFESPTSIRIAVEGSAFNRPGEAEVQVVNPDGGSNLRVVKIVASTTPKPPTDPEEDVLGLPTAESLVILQCHTPNRDVHLWKNDLTAGTGWIFVATLEHQYDKWGICAADGVPAETIDLDDGHDYVFVPVDPYMPGCIPPGGSPSDADPPAGSPDRINAACRLVAVSIRGKSGGGTYPWWIS